MYMRFPVSCSSASETDATATRRKSAMVDRIAEDCARTSLVPIPAAEVTLRSRKNTMARRGLEKLRDLSITSSRLYICARTLTPLFAAGKSQLTDPRRRTRKMNLKLADNRLMIFVVGVALAVCTAWQPAYGQEHKVVNLAPARGLPFNDGIVAGNTLYVAGQEGTNDAGKLVEGGIGPEAKATLENIEKVVKAAGFELKDIVSVTVYLADIREFPDMNKIYKTFMPDPKPPRATIQAAALVNNARIEISAIAVKQK